MADLTIINMPLQLAVTKRRAWRDPIRKKYTALAEFIAKNCLSNHPIEMVDGVIGDHVILRQSDLTEIGDKVLTENYRRWSSLVAHGRIEPTDCSLFEEALAKVRSAQQGQS